MRACDVRAARGPPPPYDRHTRWGACQHRVNVSPKRIQVLKQLSCLWYWADRDLLDPDRFLWCSQRHWHPNARAFTHTVPSPSPQPSLTARVGGNGECCGGRPWGARSHRGGQGIGSGAFTRNEVAHISQQRRVSPWNVSAGEGVRHGLRDR